MPAAVRKRWEAFWAGMAALLADLKKPLPPDKRAPGLMVLHR
jgi:hypothetical protein